MDNLTKSLDLFSKILEIQEQHDKKLYSKNVLVYYSPFDDGQFENYSMHPFYIMDNTSSLEEGVIGQIIPPLEPYYLVENDILLEFSNDKVNIFRAEIHNNILKLIQKIKNSDDNIFLVSFLRAILHKNY